MIFFFIYIYFLLILGLEFFGFFLQRFLNILGGSN